MLNVSTHSRPKAAAASLAIARLPVHCFNTQPPEGGCLQKAWLFRLINLEFQHTAARRRLLQPDLVFWTIFDVSTHSRPKAAAAIKNAECLSVTCCFNTQPPEGGCFFQSIDFIFSESFNTQPPEGGCH